MKGEVDSRGVKENFKTEKNAKNSEPIGEICSAALLLARGSLEGLGRESTKGSKRRI